MRVVMLMPSNTQPSSKQVAPILFQRDNCLESNLAYDRSSTSLNMNAIFSSEYVAPERPSDQFISQLKKRRLTGELNGAITG
jgi:hypothetical protein